MKITLLISAIFRLSREMKTTLTSSALAFDMHWALSCGWLAKVQLIYLSNF